MKKIITLIIVSLLVFSGKSFSQYNTCAGTIAYSAIGTTTGVGATQIGAGVAGTRVVISITYNALSTVKCAGTAEYIGVVTNAGGLVAAWFSTTTVGTTYTFTTTDGFARLYKYCVQATSDATVSWYTIDACGNNVCNGSVPTLVQMSNAPITTCSATFTDPGGCSANYSINQSYTQTFCPSTVNSCINVNFTSFALQSTAGTDYLKIYDGSSAAAPLIGTYFGTTSPGFVTPTNTNASGCLTFVFFSNASTVAAGWIANVTCGTCPVICPANACPSGTTCISGNCVPNCNTAGVTPPANDAIGNAESITNCGVSFYTCNYNATPGPCTGDPQGGGFNNDLDCNGATGNANGGDVTYSVENDIWYKFCPLATGPWTLNITPSQCSTTSGYQYAIFYGTATNLTQLVAGGTNGLNLTSASSINFNVTQTALCYYLQIDGYGGTECIFAVNVGPSTPGAGCSLAAAGTTICSGTTATLTASGSGGIFKWYDAATGGTLLYTGNPYTTPVLTTTTSYYVSETIGGVESARTIVTVTVNPNATITLTSAAGTNIQTHCINTAITNITYTVAGGGTGAGVTGLPAGVTGSFAGGVFTISGTPTATGTFNYTVTTTGTCAQVTATGTITVTPNATIVLSSAAGTNAQTICLTAAITTITYTVGGGGTGAGVAGLPAGVTGSFAGSTFTISGTPTATGTFNYTVTTTGTCTQVTATGTIIVNPNATIVLTSAAGTNAQTKCINTAITNIVYSVAGGGTGAGVAGLPAGVTGSFVGGVFTISGTPTVAGTFNYTVTTTGTCTQTTATGTITVSPNAIITLTSAAGTNAQTICLTNPIITITYSVTGGGTGAGVTGLPAGVTGSYAGGVFTISGTPTAIGTFNYTVTTTGTCTQVTALGSIIVNPNATISLTSAAGTNAQTMCINIAITNITYLVAGSGTGAGVTGLPAGVTGSFAGGVFTISGTPTASGTFNYTVTTTGTCTQATATGSITVNPLPGITSIPFTNETTCGANDGTITINATGTGLTYSINGGTSYVGTNLFTGLAAGSYTIVVKNAAGCTINGGVISISSAGAPATPVANAAPNPLCEGSALTLSIAAPVGGVTYNWSGPGGYSDIGSSVSIPSVTTAMTGIYTVTGSVGSCVSPGGSVTVTVNPNAVIALTSAVGTDAQTLCQTNAINTITYSITGGGTGAGITGLPAGVTGSFAAGVFTISGTPTVTGTFNYSITTSGTCTQAIATGSILINPNAVINLTSAVGTNTPTLCINTAIASVTYSITGGGAGAGVTGLPAGVTGSFVAGVFTISGTPSVTGTFNYTVTTTGTCTQTTATGTITVNPDAAISLTSSVGTNTQTLCINTAITTITYSITGGGTGAGITGLPAGITGSYAGGIFTIFGTPTVAGTFNYTITTTGTCNQATSVGSISVNPDAAIALTSAIVTDAQTLCEATAITTITYSITGGGANAGVTGLPAGVTGSFSAGVFTISGTPTVTTGTFNYTVTTAGTCTQASATGSIQINPDAVITLTSAAGTNSQTLCANTPITSITYSVTGGGTGAGVTGLPAGVTGSFAGVVFTVFGTPTASGIFNYSVTTTGSCTQATAIGSIIVDPDASINLTSAAGTDAQTPCLNSAIIPITYSVTGGGISAGVTGLPAGVAGSFASGVFTISGTPTATGTFNYTVTTTGTCAQTTAFGSIVINPDAAIALTSTIGTDAQTVCINTAISAITYSVSGGGTGAGVAGLPTGVTGSFSGGVFTISGTPSASGIFNYTITTTGTCAQAIATGNININALPLIDTTNIVITTASCGMSDGSITGITASGATVLSYTWNSVASATTDLINIPVGAYTLVAMDLNNCTSSMGPVQIINPGAPAAPAASSPPAYCQGDVIADLTATGTGGTLTWYSDAGLTTQIGTGSPFASGATNTSTFYVTEIISGCQSSPTIITVTINPTPAAPTAPSPPAYCLGDPIFDLTATGTGGTLTWFGDMALTNQLATGSPFVSGATVSSIFYVTETASGCQSLATAVTITIDSLPVITSIPFTNESACGTPDGTITINATGNGLLYSIDGGVTFVASNLFTGLDIANYTVVVKNSAGCITNGGIVSISFIGNPLMPTAIANPNPVCVDSTLTLSVSAPVGGETYTWYGPGAYLATGTSVSIPTITPSMGGTYSVTATNGNCVSPAGTISVTVNPNAIVNLTSAIGTDSQTSCVNSLINTITYSITGGGTGAGVTGLPSGITGSFAGGIFTISGTPSVTGTYNYTITTTGTCVQAIVTGSITVNPNAAITLTSAAGTNGQVLCINTSITSITYSITGGGTGAGVTGLPAGVTGTFSGGVFTISGTPTISGTFNYTVTTTGTCTQAIATGSINVNPNASIALTSAVGTNTQTICINASITTITYSLTGGGTGAGATGLPAGVTGSFAGGVFTISGTPTAVGSFNYTITTTGACAPSSAIGSIMVNSVPTAPGASSNSPVCEGSAINLTSNTVTGATYSWTGPNGFTSPAEDPIVSISAIIAMSGTYSVTVTVAGCTSPAGTTSVIVNPLPVVSAGADAMIISGSSITLTASGGGSYLWSTGEVTNPITVSPTVTTDYCVTVLDANSCSDSDCVRITVEIPCGTLFVPLAFSPNGDNENDVLSVYGDCITYLEFVIFDRWGEKIFETSDSAISWDGTYKGKKLDPAVFVYYLKATVKGESINKHGNITLTK